MRYRRPRSVTALAAHRSLLALALLAAAWSGWAGAANPDADTAKATAGSSPVAGDVPDFRSAYGDYRRYAPQALRPWPELNDEVGRAGGWRAYAREIHEARGKTEGDAAAGVLRR